MLSRFKLIHTLILGFGLLGLLILYITNLGHSSTAQLKDTLDYIAGDAWDTADGAMEGTIGVELQMLSIEQYLADANNKEALENLKEGKALEDEALGRMISAGQIDADAVAALNQARKQYQQSSELLLKDYDDFTALEQERRRAYESLLATLGEVEELGDQFVGQYADTPNKNVSWNSGLKRAWTVADGVMEYRIMILSRGSNYQALLLSKDFDTYLPQFDEPWQEIQAIIDELGVKKKRAVARALNVRKISAGEYKGQTYAKALLNATETHKQTFDKAIESLKVLHQAYLDYKAKADALLSLVEEVEETADGKVESVTATIQDSYDAITLKMAITLAITILIALFISATLIRFILSQTNSAKQLAQSITSGNLDNTINSNPKTEFGALMLALDNMQTSLKDSRDQMSASLNKTKRIVDALDNASAKIIITQADGQVVFANKNLNEYFKQHQNIFSQKVQNLAGKDLRDPEVQLFKDLNIALDHDHLHELHIDDKTLEVNVQAIKTDSGETIGFFTEWSDVTDTLAIQKEVKHLIAQASKGSLEQRLHTEGLSGFLLELSEGINSMMTNIQTAMQDFVSVSTKLSQGDFSSSVNTDVEGDLKILKDALNEAIQNVSSTLTDILSTSQVVRGSANNISSTSSEVSDQASNNAASIEEIAASLEEMTASVQQSAQYTRQVNDSSNKTMSQAESNAKIVDESVSAMESIKEVSIKIDGITNLIDSIAFQTNLLALNAAVEAARAGEHGRGFAVVAGEVRSLAQKSADAAKDIKSLVMEVNEKVGQGSDLVQSSSEGLTTMISEIKSVAEMIAEVSRSSAEQESGISQINSAVTNFDSATQQSAAMVGETATTSQELLKLMMELENKLEKFKLSSGHSLISK